VKPNPYDLSRVVLVGGGRSGLGALERLRELGGETVIVEDDEGRARKLKEELVGVPIFSTEEFLRELGPRWSTTVMPSPGVRPTHPLILEGRAVISEVELGYLLTESKIVGVTGTNGKTTVTQMVVAMLQEGGCAAVGCGNLGLPLTLLPASAEIAVVELSSFQLLHCERFHAEVALWTNLTPDHLDYHGDMDHYKAAKERIFRNQSPSDLRVLNFDDPEVVTSRRSSDVREVFFSIRSEALYGLRADEVIVDGEPLMKVSELGRTIPHDIANLLGASAVVKDFGVGREVIAEYFREFQGFEHRIEPAGVVGGVAFFNDSKATTPASTLAAAAALPSAIVVVGGRNKGLDLSPMGALCDLAAGVVVFGESAREVEEVVSSQCVSIPLQRATTMDEVVERSFALARTCGTRTVLFSPGGTSFDWYENYQVRGRAFKDAVQALALRWKVGEAS
jgi:UDP-N-acetylmuramoylalanine--D-glutamate ligase